MSKEIVPRPDFPYPGNQSRSMQEGANRSMTHIEAHIMDCGGRNRLPITGRDVEENYNGSHKQPRGPAGPSSGELRVGDIPNTR